MAKTSYPGGGLYIVENDVSLLLTTMRRGVRWNSHSHQEEEQDALIKGLSSLKKILNSREDLSQLEPFLYLAPFLEIIRSETTGSVTSLALSAINKIISYGIIDPEHPTIAHCMQAVADAVTHTRFIGSDVSADAVVFIKVLQVLRTLVLSSLSDHLTNERMCEILLSCFRICFDRHSELIRKTAEHCLRDIVQHLFMKLPYFVDDSKSNLNMKKMRTSSIDNTRSKNRKNKNHSKPKKTNQEEVSMEEDDSGLVSPVDTPKTSHLATTPTASGGNIVDMQDSLDQSEKLDEEKNINKPNSANTLEDEKSPTLEDNSTHVSGSEENHLDKQNADEGNTNSDHQNSEIVTDQDNLLTENEKDSKSAIQSPVGSIEDLSVSESINMDSSKGSKNKTDDQCEEYVNAQGVRFTPLQQQNPYGASCIRELFSFLISLCNPLDKTNTEIIMHLGLSLLQVALEISADAISNFSSLLALMKDDLCRILILLLGTERLSILATNLQVSFLIFESQREHLKFQMEHYITKLMDIVNLDSTKIMYEQRELALEALVRLWRIPGLPAELYINYDCGLYSSNLYEELMKLLSETIQNESVVFGSMYSLQFISLDALFFFLSEMEKRSSGKSELCISSRHTCSQSLPTREDLLAIKANKQLLAIGTEKFNENSREGIAKLVEHGMLSDGAGNPDPEKIAVFLRENPGLDKKAIGEYLSKKHSTQILKHFVENFDLKNMRIDQALRMYLETFRLPGESPLISLLLEKFANHWHNSNGKPFNSADAAFTLAYAVIMLNVDQHNHNVKRQNVPMTLEDFKKNLKKVDKGEDLDQDMLDEIYTSIKNEEIIMPAEQTGLVKENYLWKVLLRRGMSAEGVYLKVGNSSKFTDRDLAERAWPQIISALCRAYDKAPDRVLQQKVAQAFVNCAAISDHYNMTSDLDTLIVSLCKFTGLAVGGDPDQVAVQLGESSRRQLAVHTLFKIVQMHGHTIRASWKNIVDCLRMLFKARLLPKSITEGEDFLDPSGKVSLLRPPTTPKNPTADQGIMLSFFSYITDSARLPSQQEEIARKKAEKCVSHCCLKQIIEESKFLLSDSLQSLVGALVSVSPRDEDVSVFLLEILLRVTIENRDRVACIWPVVQARLDGLLTTAARENQPYLLERASIGMLRLAIRLLRSEEFACTVLPPLIPLTYLPSITNAPLCRQIAYGLFELLKTGAANIHSTEDWQVVFNLLECAGAGAVCPKPSSNVPDETKLARNSILEQNPVPEWVLVSPTGTEAPLPVAADVIVLDRDLKMHDPAALVKCCESLTFLVRDVAHVTPFNFELCVRCVRTFAEAVLQTTRKRLRVQGNVDDMPAYQKSPIQLLDLMHTLHTRTAQVFKWWADEGNAVENVSLWVLAWKPLLQGIARLCCDSRRPVRSAAITYLQSTLLAHDLAQLTAVEWSQCLEQVLFPLLAQLLGPISANDPIGVEETRVRAAMLLSKVFLHHLNPLLTLSEFLPLWLTVLDLLRAYMHADNSELLFEAIPESLKNMLLVMASAGVLAPDSNLWAPTWRTIDVFLPTLKSELFPEPTPNVNPPPISLVDQEEPESTVHVAPQQPEIAMTKSEEETNQNNSPIQTEIPNIENQMSASDVTSGGDDLTQSHLESVMVQEEVEKVQLQQQQQQASSTVVIQNETAVYREETEKAKFREINQWQNSQQQQYSHMQSQETPILGVASIIRANSEISDPSTTTMFNSAVYFNEDPTADRLFVVTNP